MATPGGHNVCMEVYPPPNLPPSQPLVLPFHPIHAQALLAYINAYLKKSPEKHRKHPSAINKVSYMKVSRLLCSLLPIQDGQLRFCLNWENILKWFFSKYYQVCVEDGFSQIWSHILIDTTQRWWPVKVK